MPGPGPGPYPLNAGGGSIIIIISCCCCCTCAWAELEGVSRGAEAAADEAGVANPPTGVGGVLSECGGGCVKKGV